MAQQCAVASHVDRARIRTAARANLQESDFWLWDEIRIEFSRDLGSRIDQDIQRSRDRAIASLPSEVRDPTVGRPLPKGKALEGILNSPRGRGVSKDLARLRTDAGRDLDDLALAPRLRADHGGVPTSYQSYGSGKMRPVAGGRASVRRTFGHTYDPDTQGALCGHCRTLLEPGTGIQVLECPECGWSTTRAQWAPFKCTVDPTRETAFPVAPRAGSMAPSGGAVSRTLATRKARTVAELGRDGDPRVSVSQGRIGFAKYASKAAKDRARWARRKAHQANK